MSPGFRRSLLRPGPISAIALLTATGVIYVSIMRQQQPNTLSEVLPFATLLALTVIAAVAVELVDSWPRLLIRTALTLVLFAAGVGALMSVGMALLVIGAVELVGLVGDADRATVRDRVMGLCAGVGVGAAVVVGFFSWAAARG